MKKLFLLFALIGIMTVGAVQTAQAQDGTSAGYPFLLGAAKGADNNPVPLMHYTLGTNPGTVPLDGAVHNLPLAETFARFETKPDSDHPDGTAYIWVYDDAQNVYFVCDWTSDNTLDNGEDYFTVHVDDGTGVKAYTQHTDPVGGEYGISVFGMTHTIDYEHMWYVIAVPKAGLEGNALKAGFELYGTAATDMSLTWTAPPPADAAAGEVTFSAHYSGESTTENHIVFLVECEDADALTGLASYRYFEDGTIYTKDEDTWDNIAIEGVEILDYRMFTIETYEQVEDDIVFVQPLTEGTHIIAVVAFHYYGSDYESLSAYAWNASPMITATVNVVPETGINSPAAQQTALHLYPNPVKDELRIESAGANGIRPENVKIVDLSGKTVISTSLNDRSVNVSHLSSGIYLVKIETDKGTVTEKIVKE